MKQVSFIFIVLVLLSSCSDEKTYSFETSTTEGTVTMSSSTMDIVKICDEKWNVYASESDAEKAGLTRAQYGATYCPEYVDAMMKKNESIDSEINNPKGNMPNEKR